jgi:hypothetical protein
MSSAVLDSDSLNSRMILQMSWPSGLRRMIKAHVFIGVGSNPTDIILFSTFHNVQPFALTRFPKERLK